MKEEERIRGSDRIRESKSQTSRDKRPEKRPEESQRGRRKNKKKSSREQL